MQIISLLKIEEHMVSAFKSLGALTNLQSPPWCRTGCFRCCAPPRERVGARRSWTWPQWQGVYVSWAAWDKSDKQHLTLGTWEVEPQNMFWRQMLGYQSYVITLWYTVYTMAKLQWKWKDFYLSCDLADLRNYSSNERLVKIIPQSSQQDIPKSIKNNPYRGVGILKG